MEKVLENLQEAEEIIKKIDHLVYVSFPLLQDKKLLLNVITETKEAIKKCINVILQQEYFYRRIRIYKDPKINFKIFKEKCAKRYDINKQEIELISELFEIEGIYQKSSFEFVKNNKIMIISENLESSSISLEKIKQFLNLGKNILLKTKRDINKNLR
jgi:hypothetical protein